MNVDVNRADQSPPSWRCFFAALPELESQRRLSQWVEEFKFSGRSELRWVPSSNWHLTLSFLGPISAHRADALGEALRERTFVAPLDLALREIGPFPRTRPRTLAARLEADEALLGWVGYLRECSVALGFPRERRAYQAHLTIARPRRVGLGVLPAMPARGQLRFDRIALMRSDLGPGGARYRSLAVNGATATRPPGAIR